MKPTLRLGQYDTGAEIRILAVAEMTEDMVDTLATYFQNYAADGVVSIEVTNKGLWVRWPENRGRQFLGLARLEDRNVEH